MAETDSEHRYTLSEFSRLLICQSRQFMLMNANESSRPTAAKAAGESSPMPTLTGSSVWFI